MSNVYLDPGHGGTDPGATGNGLREKDLTLKISLYTRDYLINNYQGVQVRMSRTTDKTVSLRQRTNDANNWGADVLASVHINAHNASATGYEDFIFNGSVSQGTRDLQNTVHGEMKKLFSGFTNRGKKRANFHMLRESKASAILPEFLFITNKKDAAFLKQDGNLKKIAEHFAIGIANHLGLKGKGDNTVAVKKSNPKIQTGGLNNVNLIKVIDYFRNKGWYGEAVLNWENGNPKIMSGGLSTKMQQDYEKWLIKNGYWYKIID